jgi:hypothetical protein
MIKRIAVLSLGFLLAGQAWGNSLTVSGLFDGEDGRSVSLLGSYAPLDNLTLGASMGHSQSKFQDSDEEFSGNDFGVSADVDFSAFFAHAAAQRWRDSGQLRSTSLHGELGWMSESGIAVAALVTRRDLQVTYTATVLGQTREREVDFKGTGFGADLSYFGTVWTAGLRFLDYDYGSNGQHAALPALAAADQLHGHARRGCAGSRDVDGGGAAVRQSGAVRRCAVAARCADHR